MTNKRLNNNIRRIMKKNGLHGKKQWFVAMKRARFDSNLYMGHVLPSFNSSVFIRHTLIDAGYENSYLILPPELVNVKKLRGEAYYKKRKRKNFRIKEEVFITW